MTTGAEKREGGVRKKAIKNGLFIIDALEQCAALPSLSQLATVFHLLASLSGLPLSPSTLITIFDFLDGQAT
jgi:hypothetical protein